MTRTPLRRLERNLVHAALERAANAASPNPINAARLHNELDLTCNPATTRRWVQQWRTQEAGARLRTPDQAGPQCRGSDCEHFARTIAALVVQALLARLNGQGDCSRQEAPASRISGTGCTPDP